jgi:hypothetical protein
MKKQHKRKIIIAIVIYFALILIVPEVMKGPTPVYKGKYDSIFNRRIVRFINENVDLRCENKKFQYHVADEEMAYDDDGYYYFATILASQNPQAGSVLVSEYNNGDVILKRLECPGKKGQWLTYTDSKDTRGIASFPESKPAGKTDPK